MTNIKNGLSAAEVAESRARYGENVLTPPKRESIWRKLLLKFTEPLIVILLVAGVMSIGIACYNFFGDTPGSGDSAVFLEPIGIFVAILLATVIAFYFEVKAEKEFSLLNQVSDDEPVQVIREGNTTVIPRREVVVGDIIVVNTGDEIPADAELFEATSLHIDESTLTGEPIAEKSVEGGETEATFPANHIMRGTKVMEGHGLARVFAVGDNTENGKVFEAAQIDSSVKTPLDEQLERLATVITRISYGIAVLLIVGRTIVFLNTSDPTVAGFGMELFQNLLESFMLGVALIVCAVPEGLPMAVSLCLALSMRRMMKTNNLVRRMHACETMGATTVICTDKTGTLTQNRMQVVDYAGTKGETVNSMLADNDPTQLILNELISACSTAELDFGSSFSTPENTPSDAAPSAPASAASAAAPAVSSASAPCPVRDNSVVTPSASAPSASTPSATAPSTPQPRAVGNPTEGALLLWLWQQGVDYRMMREKVVKVAEEPFTTERKYMSVTVRSELFEGREVRYIKGAPEIVFDLCTASAMKRDEFEKAVLDFQQRGMRTLGFAVNERFLGVVAIADPVRPDVPAAVQTCRDAGIRVIIVTGDSKATATEIGRQIGITDPADIISRARPLDKRDLVERLQKEGHVVAVTGDGTNDAPALNAAHVGLSMGDGTSVAKEASDITILDNSFASITRAVKWGRSLYRNIQRFVLFQMTVCVIACTVVLVGAFTGTESPLTVTQMLWVNLIMDTFAAMALASLPPTERVMQDKPRHRKDFIITSPMWRAIVGGGLALAVVLVGAMFLLQTIELHFFEDVQCICGNHPFTVEYNAVQRLFLPIVRWLDYDFPHTGTVFFTLFVFVQFWNLFNAGAFATGRSALHLFRAKGFVGIASAILIGQVLIVTFGGKMFNVEPLDVQEWLICFVATSPVLLVGELLRRR